jgi:hypothetical protein
MKKKHFGQSQKPLDYSTTIAVPAYDSNFPGYTKPIDWCQINCRGLWRYNQNGEFLFEKASDLALFTQVWKK